MTKAAGPYIHSDTGQPSALCFSLAICLQMPEAAVLTPISPLRQTHLHWNMKSGLPLASGALILFFFFSPLFALVSTPLQAEKYLSSNSLQTTTVLNLIKDITDNRGAIKQQCFQHPTGAYIPLAQRVTAVSFISQWFFKAISLLCVLPPPPHPVNQVMLVAWGNSFIRNVFYRWLWMRIALVGLQVNKWVKRECRVIEQLLSWTVPPLLRCRDQSHACICSLKLQLHTSQYCIGWIGKKEKKKIWTHHLIVENNTTGSQ